MSFFAVDPEQLVACGSELSAVVNGLIDDLTKSSASNLDGALQDSGSAGAATALFTAAYSDAYKATEHLSELVGDLGSAGACYAAADKPLTSGDS